MLGCGSGDETTSADIDPLIADDLIGQLEKIQTFLDEGNCDRASKAVGGLRDGINAVSDSTGEEFTANAIELTDELATQVEDQCVPAEKTTSSTTDTTDTLPPTTETTDTQPTTTETTTTKSTTTKSTTTTTTAPEPPTGPPGNPDNPNGNGGGGVVPGRGKKDNSGHDEKPKPKPKKAGKAKDDKRERGR